MQLNLAEVVSNIFPITRDEIERIYINKNKFIVVIYDFSTFKSRKYEGELKRNKIIFWRNKIKLQVPLKDVRLLRKPLEVGKLDNFEIWEIKGNEKLPNFPLEMPIISS